MPNFRKRNQVESRVAAGLTRAWGREDVPGFTYWVASDLGTDRRKHCLDDFEPIFGENTEAACETCIQRIAVLGDVTRRESVRNLLKFCKFTIEARAVKLPIGEHSFSQAGRKSWQRLIDSWQSATHATYSKNPRSAITVLGPVNQGLYALMDAKLFPDSLELPKGITNAHKVSKQRDSLVYQVSSKPSGADDTDESCEGASISSSPEEPRSAAEQRALNEMVSAVAEELDPHDSQGLKDSLLAMALNLTGPTPKSVDELVAALKRLAEECVLEIQKVSSAKFQEWRAVYDDGLTLLTIASEDGAEDLARAMNGDIKLGRRLEKEFIKGDRQQIANLILCFKNHFGGLVPSAHTVANKSFLTKTYAKLIGRMQVIGMIQPTLDAVCATSYLVACESAMNPAPIAAIDLPLGRQPAPDMQNHEVVAAIKRRAGNTMVFAVLNQIAPSGLVSALEAMKAIEAAGAAIRKNYRKNAAVKAAAISGLHDPDSNVLSFSNKAPENTLANSEIADSQEFGPLFVHQLRAEVSTLTIDIMANRLDYFLRDAGLSDKYRFTPGAIRPAVLMLKSLGDGPDSMVIRLAGNHESDATWRYQFDAIQRLRLTPTFREFQDKQLELINGLPNSIDEESEDSADDEDWAIDSTGTLLVSLSESLLREVSIVIACLTRSNYRLVHERRSHWIDVCEPELAWAMVVREKAAVSQIANLIPKIDREVERLLKTGFTHFLEA